MTPASPSSPLATRALDLAVDGQRLGGAAYLPAGPGGAPLPGPHPLVVCCHGMEGSWLRVAPIARRLAAAGAIAACPDFRGGGGNDNGGDPMAMTPLTELADLFAVIDAASAWPEADSSRIALLGLSLGGAVAALAAARRPTQIGALVLWYPALQPGAGLRARFKSLAEVPDRFEHRGSRLSKAYARDAWGLDAVAELARYPRPVLLIHGDRDESVPLAASLRAERELRDAELRVIPGAGHGFGDERWERAVSASGSFLAWNGILED
ncbi:alpha/beta hydrolase family protein [Actinomyces timonensis]|uniref:alpha/beta hydrolase family protein n=1 Tax=Actinomyces timonensis TaxID=1288391 RepID=UPI0002F59AA5|nr:alpha/beta fold hydrolase [Actinomyces timonensis]